MPKMKTKSGAKSDSASPPPARCFNSAYKRHMLINKPQKMKRQHRGTEILSIRTPRSCSATTCPIG